MPYFKRVKKRGREREERREKMKNFPENQFIDERVFLANGSTDFPIIVPENTLSILAPPIRVPLSTQIVYPNNLCFCQIRFNLYLYPFWRNTLTRVNRTQVFLRSQTLIFRTPSRLIDIDPVVASNPLIRPFRILYLLYYSVNIYIFIILTSIFIIHMSLSRIEVISESIESYLCRPRIDRDQRSNFKIERFELSIDDEK